MCISAQQPRFRRVSTPVSTYRFTEIGLIFHNPVFSITIKKLSKLKSSDETIHRFARLNPGRMELANNGLNDVEIHKISTWSTVSGPPYKLAPSKLVNFRKSVSISPRLEPVLYIAEGRIPDSEMSTRHTDCYDGYLLAKAVKILENLG